MLFFFFALVGSNWSSCLALCITRAAAGHSNKFITKLSLYKKINKCWTGRWSASWELGAGSGNVEWKTFLCVCQREVKTLAQRENALKNKTATKAMTTTTMSGKKSRKILQKMRTKWVCRNNFKSCVICIANNKSRCDVSVKFSAKLMLFMNHFQFIHGVWVIYGICARGYMRAMVEPIDRRTERWTDRQEDRERERDTEILTGRSSIM